MFRLYDDRANFVNQFFGIIIFLVLGGWGACIRYQLQSVETLAVRVYMAARSRVARRVASTVWPCRLAVNQRRYISPLAPLRPDRPRRFNGKFTRLQTN